MTKKDALETAVDEMQNTGVEPTATTETAEGTVTKLQCPHCGGELEIVHPAVQRRGMLAGKSLADMTVEELKREKINSSSVLYKAVKRGANEATVAANQARVDAVVAEMEKRGIRNQAATTVAAPADTAATPTPEEVAAAAAEM